MEAASATTGVGTSTPNTSTANSPEPIVVTGDGFSSFDELEAVMSQGKEAKSEAKKQAAAESAQEESQTEEGTEEDSSSGEPSPEQELKQAVEDKKQPKKFIKVTSNGKTFDLDPKTPIEVNIKGQKSEVPLQELMNNYSGATVWKQKFDTLDKERKEFLTSKQKFEASTKNIQETLNRFGDLAGKDADIYDFVEFVAAASNQNPEMMMQNLTQKILKEVEKYQTMTPEALQAERLQKENEKLKRTNQQRENDVKLHREMQTLDRQLAEIKEKHQLSNKQLVDYYDELVKYGQETGTLKASEITPKLLEQYHQEIVATDRMQKLADEVGIEGDSKRLLFVKQMKGVLKDNPDFNDQDLLDIARDVFAPKKKAKGLEKKIEAAKKTTPQSSLAIKNVKDVKNPGQEYLSFDDLI